MLEKTTVVAEGEEACKLFDCFLAYKKLTCTAESHETQGDLFTVGVIPTPELELVEKTKAKV